MGAIPQTGFLHARLRNSSEPAGNPELGRRTTAFYIASSAAGRARPISASQPLPRRLPIVAQTHLLQHAQPMVSNNLTPKTARFHRQRLHRSQLREIAIRPSRAPRLPLPNRRALCATLQPFVTRARKWQAERRSLCARSMPSGSRPVSRHGRRRRQGAWSHKAASPRHGPRSCARAHPPRLRSERARPQTSVMRSSAFKSAARAKPALRCADTTLSRQNEKSAKPAYSSDFG